MDRTLVRNALKGIVEATGDNSTPIIRRLARIQARAALESLDAEAASGAGEREANYSDLHAVAVAVTRFWADHGPWGDFASLTSAAGKFAPVAHMALNALNVAGLDADTELASLPLETDRAMVSKPTDAMIDAARKAITDRYYRGGNVVQVTAIKPREMAELVLSAALAAAPTIPATGEAVPDRFTNDTVAKALYDTWSDMPGWVPWVERGNSDMQERARREVMLCQRIEWEGTEAQQQHERMKACRERCAQMGDDDCDGDGSCEECEMDMAEALETPASRKRRALATIPATGHAATEGEGA